MNISGSLSIKTATIGGKANGSYVDSDKFKASDINFHLQVKVTNQVHDATDYTIFNKIEGLEDTQFPAVYGVSYSNACLEMWTDVFSGHFHIWLGRGWRAQCHHFHES